MSRFLGWLLGPRRDAYTWLEAAIVLGVLLTTGWRSDVLVALLGATVIVRWETREVVRKRGSA